MKISRIMLIAVLTLVTTTSVFARVCSHYDRRIDRLIYEIRDYDTDINRAERRYRDARNECDRRQHQLNNARTRVNKAENALTKLRYDFAHSDEIIVKETRAIRKNKNQLIALEAEAKRLEKKYHSISGNFFKKLKKLKAKRRWKSKLDQVKAKKREIQKRKNRILEVKHIAKNFYQMERVYERSLDQARYELEDIESLRPTVNQLQERKYRTQRRLNELRRERNELNRKLREVRNRKAQCLANHNKK